MAVAVMCDFVAALQDLLHQPFALVDDQARHEEGRLDAVAVEQVEHAAGADLPTIGALRHQDRPVGIGRVAAGPHRLGVEVEGQEERETLGGQRHVAMSGGDGTRCPGNLFVMLALVAGIHVLNTALDAGRRGWSGQARP